MKPVLSGRETEKLLRDRERWERRAEKRESEKLRRDLVASIAAAKLAGKR